MFQFSVAAEEDEVEDETVVEDEEVAEGKFPQNSDFFKENISLTLDQVFVNSYLFLALVYTKYIVVIICLFKCSVA